MGADRIIDNANELTALSRLTDIFSLSLDRRSSYFYFTLHHRSVHLISTYKSEPHLTVQHTTKRAYQVAGLVAVAGCTVEACEFAKAHPKFGKLDAVVLGISPDGLDSHAKFIKKFGLPFQLLADEEHKMAMKYGVWVEKSMYGKTFMGIQRSTFLVDRKGKIAQVWPKAKPAGHAAEVLAALKAI